ncbi:MULTISPECIES: replication initiator [Streptomyces]|uniref:replication initiator n=1 Tax=Streptomyces TaxID=1883 RepID=UPI000B80ECAF|nr:MULTISPECIES: replication initiator [Streptomyces]
MSETVDDVVRLAGDQAFPRWLDLVRATGGCAHPVALNGWRTDADAGTGEVLSHYDTASEPGERLLVRCGNRRRAVCEPCSWLHAGDTWQLVRAGLLGGKGVPDQVRSAPRLFVTLTAPSFGAVHRSGQPRPGGRHRADLGRCRHGRLLVCPGDHGGDDPLIGQPVCGECYDYAGHVLWNASVGRLWKAFTDNLWARLAAALGMSRSALRQAARVSYAKVAEYQRRGAVHLHAVVRLDGAGGPGSAAPAGADAALLADCVRGAAAAVALSGPECAALGERILRWGDQIDVREIGDGCGDDADAVASYVAKYVTKSGGGTTAAGGWAGLARPVTGPEMIKALPVSAHVRALLGTCWRLGALPELAGLRLRAWAHQLGFRGHVLTKSRVFSTTYRALRSERAAHVQGRRPWGSAVITVQHWRYAGSGHSPGAALLAAGIAADLARNREVVREEFGRGPHG